MAWCIEQAKPQGAILDPFMGSGPVLMAAQFLGYQATGIEISEAYCKVAVERLRQPSFFSIPEPVPQDEQLEML